MSHILTRIGEEWYAKNNIDSASLEIGVYNDSTDGVSDPDDLVDINTEPTNSNYSRVTDTFTAANISGDWGGENDSQLSYDFSDQTTSETVDSWFVVANFTSSEAGDGSDTDHLVSTGALEQDRDIGSIDTLNVDAGGVSVAVD